MKTLRHYFVTDDLDVVEKLESRLKEEGLSEMQLHVLTNDVAEADARNLSLVASLFRRDLVRSLGIGAGVGAVLASIILGVVALLGLPGPILGWTPYAMLAIVAFGFCTWEGGLIGIEEPNNTLKQFDKDLADGRHVFFADVLPEDINGLVNAVEAVPSARVHRLETGKPRWLVRSYDALMGFVDRNLLRQTQVSR